MQKIGRPLKALIPGCLVLGAFLYASQFQVQVAHSKIGVEDPLNISVVLTGEGNPKIESGDFISSGVRSQNKTINIIGGQATIKTTLGYVLQPRRTGSLEFFVSVGKERQGPFRITVVPGSIQKKPPPARQPRSFMDNIFGGATSPQINPQDYFIRYLPAKKNLYVGETTLLKINFYSKDPGIERVDFRKFPEFIGLASTLLTNEREPPRREKIKGLTYVVHNLRNYLIYPTVSGNLEIKGASLISSKRNHFLGNVQDIKKIPDIKMTAREIPTRNRPPFYQSAVGDFQWTVSLDKKRPLAREPLNLKIDIRGKGNFESLEIPDFESLFDKRIAVKQARAKTTYQVNKEGMSGKKSIEYYLIPQQPGRIDLPKLKFSYFNPQKGAFKTLSHALGNLRVRPNKNLTGLNDNKVPPELLLPRFIKTTWSDPDRGVSLFLLTVRYLSAGVFLFSTFIVYIRIRNKRKPKKSLHEETIAALEQVFRVKEKNEIRKALELLLMNYLKRKFHLPAGATLRECEKKLQTLPWQHNNPALEILEQVRSLQSSQFAPTTQPHHERAHDRVRIKELIEKAEVL